MAATRIAINGFGRIGRLALRALVESKRKDIKVIALNDLGPVKTNAHLLKYDTIHGPFPGKVKAFKNAIDVGAGKIQVFAERDPSKLPWKELRIDLVLECTGFFTKREDAALHIKAGAKRVLISAPATGADLTVVYGVNDKKLRKKHKVISNASCTTNCLAPVAQTLNNSVGIAQGFMTTIHAYTADQRVQDTLHGDLRRCSARTGGQAGRHRHAGSGHQRLCGGSKVQFKETDGCGLGQRCLDQGREGPAQRYFESHRRAIGFH